MNSFTENACANFLASLNMSDAGIIPFDFTAFDEIITESMYDSIFEYDNPARKGSNRKAKGNGKRNSTKAKRLHKADRYHGKHVEPYLYKENGEIKESIEDVWKRCHYPVSDEVHYKSALKANAREMDFFLNPSFSEFKMEQEKLKMEQEKREREMELEEEKWEAEQEDELILDNHYAVEETLSCITLVGNYIFLVSWWNGFEYEMSCDATNQFKGIKTAEEVRDIILTEQVAHDFVPEISRETIHDIEGTSVKWDEGWGYMKFTFLPIDY